jgi:DNA-binding CsgD family transcriptional regulator/putative methionine-R-sulfoxide reductase with GAF domain
VGPGLDEAVAHRIYKNATDALTRKHRFEAAWFGERVEPDGLRVGFRSGATTDLSDKTLVRPGRGLGGLVFASKKIQAVDNYVMSPQITHDYDERVQSESLTRVVGAPVTANGNLFGVVMVGSREGATFGNRATALVENAAQQMSDALMAAILRERLAALESAARDTVLELRALEARAGASVNGIRARERDVLARVALGHTNREIAQTMHLSEWTVKSYLRNLMNRLGVRTRTEAIAYARSAGLI